MEPINRIFLIDDDKISNMINAEVIRHFDPSIFVRSYTDALLAIQVLEQLTENDVKNIPDIIFLDINMPIIDGWEFLERFKAMPETIQLKCKIYILTSSIDPEDISRSRNYAAVTSFISKPLTLEHLALLRDVQVEQLSMLRSSPRP